MTVIESTSVRVNTLADGSLRLTVDIEPRHALDAFRLFASPGTPMALAALKMVPLSTEPEKPKGGELCRRAVMLCKDPEFQKWSGSIDSPQVPLSLEQQSAEWIRWQCQIESRSELDHDKGAEERFRALVLLPWAKYKASASSDRASA